MRGRVRALVRAQPKRSSHLANQPLSRAVVSLALAPAAELDLVPLEVRLRLLYLDERLRQTTWADERTTTP